MEETQSETIEKVFLRNSKNRPRDDNHWMSTLDQASLQSSLANAMSFNTGLGLQPRIRQEEDHKYKDKFDSLMKFILNH